MKHHTKNFLGVYEGSGYPKWVLKSSRDCLRLRCEPISKSSDLIFLPFQLFLTKELQNGARDPKIRLRCTNLDFSNLILKLWPSNLFSGFCLIQGNLRISSKSSGSIVGIRWPNIFICKPSHRNTIFEAQTLVLGLEPKKLLVAWVISLSELHSYQSSHKYLLGWLGRFGVFYDSFKKSQERSAASLRANFLVKWPHFSPFFQHFLTKWLQNGAPDPKIRLRRTNLDFLNLI